MELVNTSVKISSIYLNLMHESIYNQIEVVLANEVWDDIFKITYKELNIVL